MTQVGWQNAPVVVTIQVQDLVGRLRALLSDQLLGIYLHGSLAMGCFNPESSDVDILVVTRGRMPVDDKRQAAEMLLALSGKPSPIEISCLAQTDLIPWQFPVPFDFHFSEMWRTQIGMDLKSGDWKSWNHSSRLDPDLAAHIVVTRKRGICLWGSSATSLFPQVPFVHYMSAIWEHDTKGASQTIAESPVYAVLNLCRILLFLCENQIASKDEGGAWGCHVLPKEFQHVVRHALDLYRGDVFEQSFDPERLERFATYMTERIQSRIDGTMATESALIG